jgi:hypothetical protein
VEGDACFRGDLRVRSLHVQGSLTVEGGINGQLVTPPEAADYAEWFGKVDPAERIEAGDVVQLQSPAQKVSKRTDGEGPILVVSTKPSVAAGVPFGARPEQGCLLAFLGQVPVRVMGPVSVGDLLVPSGLSDGLAVRARHGLKNGDAQGQHEPLGTAMEACGAGRHTVLSFVRWAHNSKWAGIQQSDAHARSTIQRVWFGTHRGWGPFALGALGALALGVYTPSFRPALLRGLLLGDLASVLWAVLHAPDYVEFVFEVHLFYALALGAAAWALGSLANSFGFWMPEHERLQPMSRSELASTSFEIALALALLAQVVARVQVFGNVVAVIERLTSSEPRELFPAYWRAGLVIEQSSFYYRLQHLRAWRAGETLTHHTSTSTSTSSCDGGLSAGATLECPVCRAAADKKAS